MMRGEILREELRSLFFFPYKGLNKLKKPESKLAGLEREKRLIYSGSGTNLAKLST